MWGVIFSDADAASVARALADAALGRVLWGTNWPHTAGGGRGSVVDLDRIEPFRSEDDARNLGLLTEWLGEDRARDALAAAPARAFGFYDAAGAGADAATPA